MLFDNIVIVSFVGKKKQKKKKLLNIERLHEIIQKNHTTNEKLFWAKFNSIE